MTKLFKSPLMWIAFGVVMFFALMIRSWNITANEFVFYDEGMYLGQNRALLHLIEMNPAHSIGEFIAIMGVLVKTALSTAKAFWFFLLNLRVFIVGTEAWYVARVVSFVSGLGTILLVFFFARRYFNNNRIALLSVCILSVLPSHVFYSRLGMQESLSTLLFLGGMYCYVFARGLSWRSFVAGLLLAVTFFCNYRMIIAPIFLVVIELYRLMFLKERIDVKRFLASVCTFVFLVWWVGSLYDNANHNITFGWMGHQAHDATGKFDLLKFLAFPLNTFILEGVFVGVFFWHGLLQATKKKFHRLLPMVLVLTQMAIFSIAADQGARYLCVVLPFFAITCAQAMDELLERVEGNLKKVVSIFIVLSFLGMMLQSYVLASNRTQYGQAVAVIKAIDPQAKIISTQPLVTQMFVANEKDVKECPKNLNELMMLVSQGYFYLMIDPQAYISWSKDDIKFNSKLLDFLEDIRTTTPLLVLPQFNQSLLTRFVLDHNEHVVDSYSFILARPKGIDIEVYDLRQVIARLSGK